ncbi:MAG: MFS transporter [Chloroflexi bacterium]|nr:MFS transporter [Chloroflexota bacterium]
MTVDETKAVDNPGAHARAVPEARPARRPGFQLKAFSSLRNRNYRYLWLGQVAASSGMWMEQVSRAWLIWEMTKDPLMLGLVQLFRAGPMLVFGLVAGVAADRFDKRFILICSKTVTSSMHFVLAVLIVTGQVQVWQVFATAFITGTSMAFDQPARQSLIPVLVGRDNLMNAISLNSIAMNTSRIFGPSLAGVLIALMGIGGTYFFQGGIYSLALLATFLLVIPPGDGQPRGSTPYGEFKEGLAYVWQERLILVLLMVALIPIILAMPYTSLMPVFADQVLGVGPQGLGLLLSAPGIGSLVGAGVIATLGDFKGKGKVLLAGLAVFGISLLAFSLSTSMLLSLAVLTGVGIAFTIFQAVNNTVILTSTPPPLHGRVMSIYMMDRGLMPLGSAMMGFAARYLGAPLTLSLAASLCLFLVAAVAIFSPRMRNLD